MLCFPEPVMAKSLWRNKVWMNSGIDHQLNLRTDSEKVSLIKLSIHERGRL